MRIITGSAKGKNIGLKKAFSKTTGISDLRPTLAKVRESVFNIIGNRIEGAVFLDLYAGTGGVGLEALSRGASKVVFVESSGLRADIIRRFVSEFGFSGNSQVVMSMSYDFIKKEYTKMIEYDIIFLDPPYQSGELMKIFPFLGEENVLKDSAMVLAEYPTKTDIPCAIKSLRIVKKYKYGDTSLALYRLEKI